jgi:hypothetical protein
MKFLISKVICDSLDALKSTQRKQEKLIVLQNLKKLILKVSQDSYFIEIVPGILSEIYKIILDKNFIKVKVGLLEIFTEIVRVSFKQFHSEIFTIIKILKKFIKERELKLEFSKLLILYTELEKKRTQEQNLGLEEGLEFLVRSLVGYSVEDEDYGVDVELR